MTRYFVKQTITTKKSSYTFHFGKMRTIFGMNGNGIRCYQAEKFGFKTIPAAKRSKEYRNRTGFDYKVDEVKILRIDFNSSGMITNLEYIDD